MLWNIHPESECGMGKLMDIATDILDTVQLASAWAMVEMGQGHDRFG